MQQYDSPQAGPSCQDFDVAIVGAGPAGMTAAIYARRANLTVLLLDKLAPGGQVVNTLEVQNYPGFGTVNGAELAIRMFEHTQALGVCFDYGTVETVKRQNGTSKIVCKEGQSYQAKAVIIATGTIPRTLGVDGEQNFSGNGISWCAICDGAQYRDRNVVVIGGGNSAVEESLYLAGIAKRLSVITLYDLTADRLACQKLQAMPNVDIFEYHEILEFVGSERLEGVKARCVKTNAQILVKADGVFEYIGLKPTAEPFAHLGILNDQGYISTDSLMATRVPGIFGAGDINHKQLRQIVTACNDGAIAAQAAAGYIEKLR